MGSLIQKFILPNYFNEIMMNRGPTKTKIELHLREPLRDSVPISILPSTITNSQFLLKKNFQLTTAQGCYRGNRFTVENNSGKKFGKSQLRAMTCSRKQ